MDVAPARTDAARIVERRDLLVAAGAWVASRIVILVGLLVPRNPTEVHIGRLILLDGQWFQIIARHWYDRTYVPGNWSTFPFFPLFPAIGGLLIKAGAPATAALAGTSWLATYVALVGLAVLARRHLAPDASMLAPALVALAPGALALGLGYSDSLYLAGLVWAMVLAEDDRWVVSGIAAMVATAARPNGWIAVVVVVVLVARRTRRLRPVVVVAAPAVVFFASWCGYLWARTGDPIVFMTAKEAWSEVTIVSLVKAPFSSRNQPALFHLACAVVLVAAFVARRHRMPLEWTVLVVIGVVPSFVLGMEGLARYATLAFPTAFAAADLLTARRRWPGVIAAFASAGVLGGFTLLMLTRTWLP